MRPYEETIERAAELVRMVIPKLAQAKLPINPINYALWYEYFLGRDKALMNSLDLLIKEDNCCDTETAENLFRMHILGVPTDRLEMIGGKVHNILDSTSDLLSNTSNHLEQFNREMTHTQAVLDEAVDPAEIRPLVTGLIKASESMITSNSELSQHLTLRSGEIERLKHEIETIRAEAALDPLTGIANRKTLQEAIINALATQGSSQKRYVCLIMIDIDRFKVVNDKFGHLVGDRVLRYVAEVLTESVKGKDTVARFGGEEFCVVLPDTTPEGAQAVGENIRKTIEDARLRRGKDGTLLGKITVSIGIAWGNAAHSAEDLLERADQALYQSKRNGRNIVSIGGLCQGGVSA